MEVIMVDLLKQYKNYIIVIALILICCAFPRFAYFLLIAFVILLAIYGGIAIFLIDYVKRNGVSKAKEKLTNISKWLKEEKNKLEKDKK